MSPYIARFLFNDFDINDYIFVKLGLFPQLIDPLLFFNNRFSQAAANLDGKCLNSGEFADHNTSRSPGVKSSTHSVS